MKLLQKIVLLVVVVFGVSFAPATAQDVIEIEFWTLLTGQLAERVDALVQDYNASQSAVRVINVNQGGYNELQRALLAAVAAGTTPPVTMVDFQYVPFYASNGVFVPLNELADESELSDLTPGLLGDLIVDGKLYAVPFNRSTQGMYYNKDLFRQAGLDPENPPQTWDEVLEAARAIRALGDEYYGIYATFSTWYWQPFVQSWGGEFSDANCNFTFNDAAGVAAAEFFQSLLYEEDVALIPSNLSGTFDQQAIEFVTGRVGMMRQSTAINGFIDSVVDFDWGFTMLPAGPGGRAVTGGGANLAISARAPREIQEAAWDFVSFMSSTENTARFHMETGYMPVRLSAAQLPQVQEFYQTHPTWQVSVNQLEFARPTSCATLNTPEYNSIMSQAIERIILNNEDPQTVLDQAVAELNALVEQRRAAGELIS